MRKLLLLSFLFGVSALGADFVHQLPNGNFAGNGSWTDNLGNSGGYQTYVEIVNNDMRVDYAWDDQSLTIFLSFWFYSPGSFHVIYQGGVAGEGFCELGTCYYELNANGFNYAETLSFGYSPVDGLTLSKTGEKHLGDRVVQWQDGLYYVNLGEEDPIILPVPNADQAEQK